MQQVAVLVQGNWVVNSELIYPKDSLSVQNGISELMCKARDYIVSILSKDNRLLLHKMQFYVYVRHLKESSISCKHKIIYFLII